MAFIAMKEEDFEMGDQKDSIINGPRGEDNWGIGQMADGSINVMTEEEAIKARIRRDAEEKAIDELLQRKYGRSGQLSDVEDNSNETGIDGAKKVTNLQPSEEAPKKPGS